MKRFFLFFAISWLSLFGISQACTVSGNDWSNSLNEAVRALQSGEFEAVETVVQKNIKFENTKGLETLLKSLKEYAPNGFSNCRELMRVDIPPLVTKILFELSNSEETGVYFYVFLIDGNVSQRSGIMQFRITTVLEDVLSDWGN